MKNKQVEAEMYAQGKVRTLYHASQLVLFFIGLVLWFNSLPVLALLVGLLIAFLHAHWWQGKEVEFERRLVYISFQTQIENMYVTCWPDMYGDDADIEAYKTFTNALDKLVETGNQHEVTVHLVLFRDVVIRSCRVEKTGVITTLPQRWRIERIEKNISRVTGETYEEYKAWYEEFAAQDKEERLRQLRSNPVSYEWVNEHIFKQVV